MKIYTKTGDEGQTSLLGGKRIIKSAKRIEAYGTVDELNANLGMLADLVPAGEIKERILKIQNELFDMGSCLACDADPARFKLSVISEVEIKRLEEEIDTMESALPRLKNFILPGGHPRVSQSHIARCVCRRAERRVIDLSLEETIDMPVIRYLNRLSDYLFVLARFLGKEAGVQEVAWRSKN